MNKNPPYWQDALKHLKNKDKTLARLITHFKDITLMSKSNAFETLVRIIVGQQISLKAADSVWQKITMEFKILNYEKVLKSDVERLRKCGLSQQKANYLRNISTYFAKNNITSEAYWRVYSFAHIEKELLAIKGIGNWSVQMFAIFYLLEPDIFPLSDLGLVRAMNNLYAKKGNKLEAEALQKIAKNWQPYRSVATWFLWRSIDNDVVLY